MHNCLIVMEGDPILADESNQQYKMSCLESVLTADVNDNNDSALLHHSFSDLQVTWLHVITVFLYPKMFISSLSPLFWACCPGLEWGQGCSPAVRHERSLNPPPTIDCPALPCVLVLCRSPSNSTVADVPQPEWWLYGCRAVVRSKWIRVHTPSEGGLGVDRILFSYLMWFYVIILCVGWWAARSAFMMLWYFIE